MMLAWDLARSLEALAASTKIPLSDLHYLLCEITGLSIPELSLRKDFPLSEEKLRLWDLFLSRRQAGEPPQYITGKAWFYGLELKVTPAVLIPRPETEGLVQLALRDLPPNASIVDIGTGSGAIPIALKLNRPDLKISATDISEPALIIAEENARKHAADIQFHHADLLPDPPGKLDAIISNPPYISTRDYLALPLHIREHEPETALHAGADGLDLYRRILALAPKVLPKSGLIFLEIGYDQADAIKTIAKNNGMTILESLPDLAGFDRYITIRV